MIKNIFDPYYEINDDKKYDQLVSLLKKHSICTNEKNTNLDSKVFLSQFKCPVRYLHDKKNNDPSYFEQFDNKELLEFLLKETFIRSNTMPSESDLGEMDAVFFSSGQFITLCENFITFNSIKDKINIKGYFEIITTKNTWIKNTKNIWITQLMAKYPTLQQQKICSNLLEQHDLFCESNKIEHQKIFKYAEFIWKELFCSLCNDSNIKYVECVSIIDTCKLIEKLISKYLPDLPNKILIITTQPKEIASALQNYFKNKNYPHKFYFAKNTNEDLEKAKSLYFDESRGEKVRFLLRDLAEEIPE